MNVDFFNQLQEEFKKYPQDPKLVAVTKYSTVEEVNKAIEQGVDRIGENRIEMLEEKLPDLLPVEKHFIGAIQSKKLRRIVKAADVIQSIGSFDHLEKLNRIAGEEGKIMPVFLQVNISHEGQKSGFQASELIEIKKVVQNMNNILVQGVMGMAENTEKELDLRMQFRLAKGVFHDLQKEIPTVKELSIGMSGDYRIALEEGATVVRIGSKLFK